MRSIKLLALLGGTAALHESNVSSAGRCVPPGQCTPPATKFSKIIAGPVPGQQWNINGGFCGAFSTQHAALSVGAWISQDLVRKANRNQPGQHHMHGDHDLGYEVMPSNVAATAAGLKLAFEEWDYTQPTPQAPAYKRWLKSHLARGHAIVWFPICKGDPHMCYPGSCPNGGHADHVEPMYGIYSNHPLDDPEVYDDDWIVHASDQDYMPYYRRINSLDDTILMNKNCKHAGWGFGKNEMYPCFPESVTYGLAVTGLAIDGHTLPVSITTDGATYEPNIRRGEAPKPLYATVQVSGLTPKCEYIVYRYNGTESLPARPPFNVGFEYSTTFTAREATHTFNDSHPFSSSGAVYYVAVESAEDPVEAPDRSSDHAVHVESKEAPSSPPVPSIPIAPGAPRLPLVSLGTGSGQHADVAAAVKQWLQLGGRAIDTAFIYEDESAVAKGIAESGVPRNSIFVTTKILCGSYKHATSMISGNLRQLGLDHVDLTLVHFAKCWSGGSVSETWRALEDAKVAGKTRAIGVSNFRVDDLDALKATARLWPPAVNQCSMSVGYHDDATISYCDTHGITYMAYSPLCGGSNGSSCHHGSVMSLPAVKHVAAAHHVSTAQVALKWIVQQRRPLATSVGRADYMREDLDLWTWGNLTEDEMKTLSAVED